VLRDEAVVPRTPFVDAGDVAAAGAVEDAGEVADDGAAGFVVFAGADECCAPCTPLVLGAVGEVLALFATELVVVELFVVELFVTELFVTLLFVTLVFELTLLLVFVFDDVCAEVQTPLTIV
jgi:hypothetical protein